MKKKGLFTAIIAALVAFTCAFAIACGPEKDPSGSGGGSKPQNPAPVARTVMRISPPSIGATTYGLASAVYFFGSS